jgi:long-chain acyl-CoA synthetase
MLLHDLLTQAAARWPDKPAAVFPGEAATFAQLERMSLALAMRFGRMGIGPSSRVAIIYENSLTALVCYWAVLRSGAMTVDIAPSAGLATFAALAESQPRALIIQPQFLRRIIAEHSQWFSDIIISSRGAADLAPLLLADGRQVAFIEEIFESADAEPALPRVTSTTVAMCIYTSGTTGRPKGVLLSHDNLLSNVAAFNSRLGLTHEDSLLLVAPLHYIHGRIQLLTFMMLGATIVFSSGFRFPQCVLQDLRRHRITTFSGVPFHFSTLLQYIGLRPTSLPYLRHLIITGGAPAPYVLQALHAVVPQAELHLNYGLTEASPRLTYHGPSSEVLARPTSCGRALPGMTIEILGSRDEPLPPGAIGEVVASGPGIMTGYVSGDERSAGRIDGRGRLRTGDLGHLDAAGYLYISGRNSDLIKTAGERLFPSEIEQILQTHPGVAQSVVLGLPDSLLGERVVACVVAAAGLRPSSADLRRYCLNSLPYLRVPKEIHFFSELPKTPSGKISRDALRLELMRARNKAVIDGALA